MIVGSTPQGEHGWFYKEWRKQMTLTDGDGTSIFLEDAYDKHKLPGKPPITISTEIDPDFKDEEETEGSEDSDTRSKVDENPD